MWKFINQEFFGITLFNYFIAIGIIILALIVVKTIKYLVLKKLEKFSTVTKTPVDDFIIINSERFLIPILYLAAFYIGVSYLRLSPSVNKIINSVFIVIVTFYTIRFISGIINYAVSYQWSKKGKKEINEGQFRGISTFISIIIWSIGLIFLLDNLGFQITAVITGLGIGGIAVALAAQTILGDLFSYFVIFFDRPFEIGDFIVIDDKMGVVEKIGIKTTRLASLGGEQLILSNSNLTSSRIHNFKRMENRRILFKLDVVYQTSLDTLKQIPVLIKDIIEENDTVRFDRAHFQSYGNAGLTFEIVYFILSPDYNKYMEIQQNINFRIYEEFAARKIEFAYPTQALYLNKTAT